jgi:hypothetical protein
MRNRYSLAVLVSIRLVSMLVVSVVALTGCRSPFGAASEDPEAGRVGRGVHGWPLYESAPHGSGWRTDILWPGYSSIASEGEGLDSTKLLIPVFLFETEGERRRVGFLRPVWDLETHGDRVYDLDVLWPFFKWKDAPGVEERRAFPVYFSEDRGHRGYRHLWPLYGREWNGSREKHWVLAPLFAHTSDPESNVSKWDAPWPLVHWGVDGDERDVRLLPILWHHEDGNEHQTVLFPFLWDIESGHASFFMLFPFFANYEESNGDYAHAVLPPLYIHGKDGDEEYTWLAAPLVRWNETPDSWSTHVFPILWLKRHDDGDSYTHLWPLFGWERNGDRREASVAWPFLSVEWENDHREIGLPWPFVQAEWGDGHWDVDLPWPLVHVGSGPDHSDVRVWPLFCNENSTLERDGEEVPHREGNVLFYISNWESTGEDERDFRILWKLVQSSHKAGKDTFVVNPLFRHETNDVGDTYWSFLFGLVARKQEQGDVDWRFFWFL